MNKSILGLFACLSLGLQAQTATETGVESPPSSLSELQIAAQKQFNPAKKSALSAATIWSEDFAGGVPAGWVNQGYDVDPSTGNLTPNPLCNWEYRGPGTTPNRNTGSRGAFAAGTNAISSPTRLNGFMIFDSDFLDNNGDPMNPGGGVSPAPHIGTLTTDTIDLTGFSDVEIAFTSHVRQYSSRFFVAISNDGGVTFPDTLEFHQEVASNSTSPNAEELSANISTLAGNQSLVVLQFIFDGTPSVNTASGPAYGYYYWQMDDLEIRELPDYSVRFVDWRNAPAQDIVYPAGYAKYGHINLEQAVPINFDSNIFNYGSEDLNNVRLKVDIVDDATGSVVNTFTSPSTMTVASQDSLSFNDLTTSNPWTPANTGTFHIIYSIESDSIPLAAGSFTPMDTFTMRVTDEDITDGRYSYDWRVADNFVGTDNLATGSIIAIGERFNFPAPNKDTAGFVFVEGVRVFFDQATDPNSTVIWEVYDTTGFSYGTSGGPTGNPFYQGSFSLTPQAPGGSQKFEFYDTLPNGDALPLVLSSGSAYYFLMNMLPGSTNGVVRVANDQTFTNPTFSIIVQSDAGNWFGGFGNSDNLSAPIFRLSIAETPAYDIGLKAFELQNRIKIYPNPIQADNINIEFDENGSYTMEVYDLKGSMLFSKQIEGEQGVPTETSISGLPRGVYMLHISDERSISRHKIIIE